MYVCVHEILETRGGIITNFLTLSTYTQAYGHMHMHAYCVHSCVCVCVCACEHMYI